MTDVAIVIPSLNPGSKLPNLIRDLCFLCKNEIIIVDDGSTEECRPIFKNACAVSPQVTLLRHAVNQGKGRALKTAFNYYLDKYPDGKGVITADGDGQHLPADIVNCLHTFEEKPHSLLLGCRAFNGANIPWKSKIGNTLSIRVFALLGGIKCSDTQTGLRGVPRDLMAHLLAINSGERFEFETVMLLATRHIATPHKITEVPISTIYENKNRETHFRPIVDSYRIYRIVIGRFLSNFLLFICSGLSSACLDQGLFAALFYWLLPVLSLKKAALFVSVAFARICSLGFNYTLNP